MGTLLRKSFALIVIMAGLLLATGLGNIAIAGQWRTGDEVLVQGGCKVPGPLIEMGEAYRANDRAAYAAAKAAGREANVCDGADAQIRLVVLGERVSEAFCNGACFRIWEMHDTATGELLFGVFPENGGTHKESGA